MIPVTVSCKSRRSQTCPVYFKQETVLHKEFNCIIARKTRRENSMIGSRTVQRSSLRYATFSGYLELSVGNNISV